MRLKPYLLLLIVSGDKTHYVPFQALHPLVMSRCLEYYKVLSSNKITSFLKLERPNQRQQHPSSMPTPGATSDENQCTTNSLILTNNLLLT